MGAQDAPPNPRVLVETSEGDFEIELIKDRVPATAVNFLTYVQAGYYDGTIFHRVIRDVIAQGGGVRRRWGRRDRPEARGSARADLERGKQQPAESSGHRRDGPGRRAEQRTAAVLHQPRRQLSFNHKNGTAQGFGYAVFGRVTEGMDVVRRIGRTRTTNKGEHRDVSREPIVILSITQIEAN